MKKIISIFIPSLDGGGAEKVLLRLAEKFASLDYDCDIVIAIPQGRLLFSVPHGVNLVKLNKKKTLASTLSLAKYIHRRKPDVLLTSIFSANITGLLASLLSPTKTRVVLREASPTHKDVVAKKKWKTILNELAAKTLYRFANASIAVSDDVKSSLMQMNLIPVERIHLIPNPTPITQKTGVDPTREKQLILACGRLEPQKDHSTLLRVFASLRSRTGTHLVILGEGSQEQALREQARHLKIEQDVTFVGYVENPEEYMRRATVLVHTARYEGFSSVLLEALACRCPIVAMDCPGVRMALGDGKYGALVPLDDDEGLTRAIETVLSGELTFPEADTHLQKFDLDTIADRYLSVLLPDRT